MWRRNDRLWLPRTGQTQSSRSGDDGDVRAGWPGTTRFINNGNNTVQDRATCLTWVREVPKIIPGGSGAAVGKGNWADNTAYAVGDVVNDGGAMYCCIQAHTGPGDGSTQPSKPDPAHWVADPWTADAIEPLDNAATMAWNDAVDRCWALEYAGFADWRLPNLLELYSLHDLSRLNPCIYVDYFPNTATTASWTSTERPTNPNDACYTSWGNIYASTQVKTALCCARPVRGGRING
jgi:hypothetical protein